MRPEPKRPPVEETSDTSKFGVAGPITILLFETRNSSFTPEDPRRVK